MNCSRIASFRSRPNCENPSIIGAPMNVYSSTSGLNSRDEKNSNDSDEQDEGIRKDSLRNMID